MENSSKETEAVTLDSLRQKETERDDKVPQMKYTRGEMEALRYAQLEYQLELFERVYGGLNPKVKREFDGIFVTDPKKNKNSRNRKKNKQRNKNFSEGDFRQEMFVTEEQTRAGPTNQTGMEEPSSKLENTQFEDEDISDDSYDGILKPAFLVEGEPDFESGPPVDGYQYLRRVRWEADQIPDVTVAKLDLSVISAEQTPYMPEIPDLPKCPPNLLATKKWEDSFLDDFSELRKELAQLDSSVESSDSISKSSGSIENQTQTIPTVEKILNMDIVARASILRSYIDMCQSTEMLSRHDCLWLFALCASVDMPLHADTSASLRCLLRKCLGILAIKSEMDDEVAMLSIIVSICGKYFGQYDNKVSRV